MSEAARKAAEELRVCGMVPVSLKWNAEPIIDHAIAEAVKPLLDFIEEVAADEYGVGWSTQQRAIRVRNEWRKDQFRLRPEAEDEALRVEVTMLRNQIVALEASSRTELNRAVKAEADCVALRVENEKLNSIIQKQT